MGLTSQLNRKYRSMIAKGIYPVCYLCGQPITRQNDVSQDHIVAKANSGSTTLANLATVHKVCNSRKGSMTVQQWFDRSLSRE